MPPGHGRRSGPGPWPDAVDTIAAHAHGWRLLKADRIEAIPLGWRLAVHRGGERVVLTQGTPEQVRGLLAVERPGTTLRMCADPRWWGERLPEGWVVDRAGWYFRTWLAAQPPPRHRVVVDRRGVVLEARLDDGGRTVAAGRAAAYGRWLTLDGIEVAPSYRRRGLGTSVVAALAAAGVEQGCETGVLSATPSGRGLYETMGWTAVGDQVCAVLR